MAGMDLPQAQAAQHQGQHQHPHQHEGSSYTHVQHSVVGGSHSPSSSTATLSPVSNSGESERALGYCMPALDNNVGRDQFKIPHDPVSGNGSSSGPSGSSSLNRKRLVTGGIVGGGGVRSSGSGVGGDGHGPSNECEVVGTPRRKRKIGDAFEEEFGGADREGVEEGRGFLEGDSGDVESFKRYEGKHDQAKQPTSQAGDLAATPTRMLSPTVSALSVSQSVPHLPLMRAVLPDVGTPVTTTYPSQSFAYPDMALTQTPTPPLSPSLSSQARYPTFTTQKRQTFSLPSSPVPSASGSSCSSFLPLSGPESTPSARRRKDGRMVRPLSRMRLSVIPWFLPHSGRHSRMLRSGSSSGTRPKRAFEQLQASPRKKAKLGTPTEVKVEDVDRMDVDGCGLRGDITVRSEENDPVPGPSSPSSCSEAVPSSTSEGVHRDHEASPSSNRNVSRTPAPMSPSSRGVPLSPSSAILRAEEDSQKHRQERSFSTTAKGKGKAVDHVSRSESAPKPTMISTVASSTPSVIIPEVSCPNLKGQPPQKIRAVEASQPDSTTNTNSKTGRRHRANSLPLSLPSTSPPSSSSSRKSRGGHYSNPKSSGLERGHGSSSLVRVIFETGNSDHAAVPSNGNGAQVKGMTEDCMAVDEMSGKGTSGPIKSLKGSAPSNGGTSSKLPSTASSGKASDSVLSNHQLQTLHSLYLPRPVLSSSARNISRGNAHSLPLRPTASSSTKPGSSSGSAPSQPPNYHAHSHNTASYQPQQLSIPPLAPPITRHTLRELDVQEIFRNPQLRHDIVFDPGLMFRPNFDGERGERKREAGERYWLAISRELATGCRCTTFTPSGEVLPCICRTPITFPAAGLTSSKLDLPDSGKPPLSDRLHSRIPALISELRSILLSLLPSPSVHSRTTSSSSSEPASNSAYEVICETLDPDFIAQELSHGVLDVGSLARFMGSTLKMHCAPMRDEMVDCMVEIIEDAGNVAKLEGRGKAEAGVTRGLKMCFEILELMKLDIANHQLRTYRPFLLESAVEFELKTFNDAHERKKGNLEKTKRWFSSAVQRIRSRHGTSMNRSELTYRAIRDGFLEVVFRPDAISSSSSTSHHRLLSTRSLSSRKHRPSPAPTQSQVPETWQLDLFRLQTFHSDTIDLTIVYMLFLLFRQLAAPGKIEPEDLDNLRQEIWCVMNEGSRGHSLGGDASVSAAGPGTGVKKLASEKWRDNMRDTLLQIAARADAVKSRRGRRTTSEPLSSLAPPSQATVSLLASWMDTNVRADSKLFLLLQRRLRDTLDAVLVEELAREARGESGSGWWVPVTGDAASRRNGGRNSIAKSKSAAGSTAMEVDEHLGACSRRNGPIVVPSLVTNRAPPPPAPSRNRGVKRGHEDSEDAADSEGESSEKRTRLTDAREPQASLSISPIQPAAAAVPGPEGLADPSTTPRTLPANATSLVDECLMKNGLQQLSGEVRLLGEKMSKLVSFHSHVYGRWYELNLIDEESARA